MDVLVINPKDKAEYTISVNKNGENIILCPICSHTRKKKSLKCFSYNLNKSAGRCNHCGEVLVSKKDKPIQEAKKEYKRPTWKNKTDLSNRLVKWFEDRKISQRTLKEFKICEGPEWLPQTQKEENCIQFNYFRYGELINTKYRDGKKNFKLFKDAEMIFYNLDAAIDHKEIIIVEGEMDVLALAEAGFKNVISVPNGCTEKGKINLDYYENCIDFFDPETTFILALDNDLVGNRLKDELARRIGFEYCKTVIFKDCKDANDCLIKYDIQALIESIADRKEFPIVGVYTANDIKAEIYDYYEKGLPKGQGIGINEFDSFLKFQPGYLTTITGIPGHGKSEFLDFILTKLNVLSDWKFGLFSPENYPMQLHFSKFAEKLSGKPFEGDHRMSKKTLDDLIEYHSANFHFINPEENFNLEGILKTIRQLIKKHGINGFVIDAWNKLEHKYKGDETQYISEQLDLIVNFCLKNQVHCFLVAHPTKTQKDASGKYVVPNLYSISGSANFFNKTANGFCVYRNFDTGCSEIYIQKVKFKHWGKVGVSTLAWDSKTGRYYKGTPDYTPWIFREGEKMKAEEPKANDHQYSTIFDNDDLPF